uniref:Uncharacterized protein n=1 Tax=Mycena chlorophos TaxID=658473 RepID=A0ABQ0M1R4_MYCCL|nr:predicted protein [Mycena chlorophos]
MSSETQRESRLVRVGKALVYGVITTFHAINDAEARWVPNSRYSTVRHTRAWVYYQGTKTTVPISILGRAPLPQETKITLQRRGWRTGLLGWTIGGWLGGTVGKEVDVTPETAASWSGDELGVKQRARYEKEVADLHKAKSIPREHRVLATALVHVPVSSGDGYFRFLVKDPNNVIAQTPVFRVGSLSLSSAHPRGASPVTLVPELLAKTASVALTTAAYAGIFAAFPFLKVASVLPGTSYWADWALRRAYVYVGGDEKLEELRERYRVDERSAKAQQTMFRTVPFGSMGVRTAYDLEEDARLGRGGVIFRRE